MLQKLVSTSQVSYGCRGMSNEQTNYIRYVLTLTSIPALDLDNFTLEVGRLMATLKPAIKNWLKTWSMFKPKFAKINSAKIIQIRKFAKINSRENIFLYSIYIHPKGIQLSQSQHNFAKIKVLIWHWLLSFQFLFELLKNILQRVIIGNECSSESLVISGVPQG